MRVRSTECRDGSLFRCYDKWCGWWNWLWRGFWLRFRWYKLNRRFDWFRYHRFNMFRLHRGNRHRWRQRNFLFSKRTLLDLGLSLRSATSLSAPLFGLLVP
uniref:(northern house mosquito) hypothetical protein n=1 Tax=Culex pipiens TaxID=7175 RepID=A0A8D8P602_CULPI